MDDEQIIGLFFSRSELAIGELDARYGKACYKLSYNILNDRQDAEECVNDGYLGTWNAIPPQRPRSLLAFVCSIVRNLSITRHRENIAAKRNSSYDAAMSEIEHSVAAPGSVEGEIEARELARIIEGFLDTLTEENRAIFLGRYWFCDSYGEIAERVGLAEKSVSVRLVRIRKGLRKYLVEKGVLA